MKKEMGDLTLSFMLAAVVFVVSEGASTEVCNRPSYIGPCYARFRRWHWDPVSCKCKRFIFGGCMSNGNNFRNPQECTEECGDTDCTPTTTEVCTRPKFPGRCTAYFRRWYWDFDACECKQFVYGGCQSNGNNFQTQADCEAACQNSNFHCPRTDEAGD